MLYGEVTELHSPNQLDSFNFKSLYCMIQYDLMLRVKIRKPDARFGEKEHKDMPFYSRTIMWF